MTKRILALVLASLMLLSFVGCEKDGGEEKVRRIIEVEENKTDKETKAAEKFDEESSASVVTDDKEVLVMATNAAFPPYEYIDESGNFAGIDIEIASAVAEKLGMELEIRDMEFDSLISSVQSGEADIAFAGITVTPERAETVSFTNSYVRSVQVVIVRDDSAISTIDDIYGKKIGVKSGTTGDIYCSGDYGEAVISRYDTGVLAIEALLNGQVDCVIIDSEPAKALVESRTGLRILETEYTHEEYAAAVAKENAELLEKVNTALEEINGEGKIRDILNKYIPAE